MEPIELLKGDHHYLNMLDVQRTLRNHYYAVLGSDADIDKLKVCRQAAKKWLCRNEDNLSDTELADELEIFIHNYEEFQKVGK